MPLQLENEKLIQSFLFGEMPEAERFEFEERFITDADLFEQIKAVEDELIEKYVRGWMDSAENLRFEQNFLTTKKRRERVEFSRQLIGQIEKQKEGIAAFKKNDEMISEESVWQKLSSLFLTPKIALVTAFTILVAVFGSWVIYQNLGGRKNEIVKNKNANISETSTPTPDIQAVKTPQIKENNQNTNENVGEDLDKPQTETPTPTPKKEDKTPEKSPTPTKTPIRRTTPNPVLALFAGTVRSGGKIKVLNLPKEAKGATLQINLESVDYAIYSAQLTDADGVVLFQNDNLKAGRSSINFNIPTTNLKSGDYIIKLFGKNDAGENVSVADYQFRVKR